MKAVPRFTRPAVGRLARYRGLFGTRPAIRLDGNENPLGPSSAVMQAISSVTPDLLARYPEPDPLREAWAGVLGVPIESLLLTAGSGPGLALVAELSLGVDDVCVLAAPSFELYAWAAMRRESRVVAVPLLRGFAFPAAGFRRALAARPRPRLVVIGHPDNPTGAAPPRGFVAAAARRNADTLFLVDEAYAEFTGASLIPLTRRLRNVVIARTMSKAYGLAGERVGCLVGDPEVIELLGRINIPYPITGLGTVLGLAALEDQRHVRSSVRQARRGVGLLAKGLSRLEIPCVATQANFVLFRCLNARHAATITQELSARGIAVRDRSHLPHMEGWIRVSAGTPAETDRFLREIADVMTASRRARKGKS